MEMSFISLIFLFFLQHLLQQIKNLQIQNVLNPTNLKQKPNLFPVQTTIHRSGVWGGLNEDMLTRVLQRQRLNLTRGPADTQCVWLPSCYHFFSPCPWPQSHMPAISVQLPLAESDSMSDLLETKGGGVELCAWKICCIQTVCFGWILKLGLGLMQRRQDSYPQSFFFVQQAFWVHFYP